MRVARACYLVAAVLAACAAPVGRAPASAQAPSQPEIHADRYAVDEKGTCREDELARLSGLRGQRTAASGWGYTFVMNPAAGLSRTSAVRGEGVQSALKRFEVVRLLAEDLRSRKLMVRSAKTSLCGWIEREAVLLPYELRESSDALIRVRGGKQPLVFGPSPMLVKDGPYKHELAGNTLTMKLVVQNVNQKGEAREIPVYEEPGSVAVIDKLSLFDIFEVFEFQKVDRAANKRNGPYYLVGKRGAEGPGGLGQLYGWLHDDDVQMWNSRMSAFWSGRVQALGYGFDDAAQKAWEAERERRPPPVAAAFRGPAPAGRTPDDVAVRRFPIISQYPNFDLERVTTIADVNWFKVAVRGVSCRPDAAGTPGRDCISSEDVDAERIRWQKVIESMSRVDILFVIDGTSSMSKYFAAIADAVRTFAQRSVTPDQDVNVGAVVYGDYRKGVASAENVAFERVVRMHNPVTEPRLIEALLRFKKIEEEPGDTDLLEAPFAALIKAASTRWRPEAGLRLIVHIADHGNREPGKTSEEYTASGQLKSTLKESVTAQLVEQALKERGITYLPIAVAGAYDPVANEKFRNQARDLIQRINLQSVDLLLTYDEQTGVDRESDRSAAVLKRLDESVTASREAARVTDARLRCARSKSLDACGEAEKFKRSESWTGRFADKLSEELLPKTQIENIHSRTETVTALHFPPVREDKEVFSYWLAIEPRDLASLVEVSTKVCERFSQRTASRTLFAMIESEVGIGAGEYQSPAEVYEKRFFVPAAFTLDFFRKPWDQIESELSDPVGYARLQKQVCRTSFLLGRVLSGKRVEEPSMAWNEKIGGYTARNESDFAWRIKPDNGIELFYVPLTYLK